MCWVSLCCLNVLDLYFSYGVIYCVVWKKKITIEVPGSDKNNKKYGQVARSRVGVENLIPVWDFNICKFVCWYYEEILHPSQREWKMQLCFKSGNSEISWWLSSHEMWCCVWKNQDNGMMKCFK